MNPAALAMILYYKQSNSTVKHNTRPIQHRSSVQVLDRAMSNRCSSF